MPEIIVKLGDRIIHRYLFDKDALSIGRARDNDIVIENLSVSRNHAKIKKQDGKFILTDLNSANGTLINGVRVSKTEVVHDDVVTIGKHVLHFLDQAESAADAPIQVDITPPAPSPLEQAVASSSAVLSVGFVGVLRVSKGKQAGQEFRAVNAETSIGRASENDIRLHDWFVSKKHAVVIHNRDLFTLRDLDSWRGTTVNGNSIKEIDLSEGDEIVFGTTVLTFHKADASQLKELPPPPVISDAENYEQDSQLHRDLADKGGAPPVQEEESSGFDPVEDMDSLVIEADDEFAPLTEDELEALELDAELHTESDDEEEEHRKAMWEMLEAEKMFEMGGEGDQKKFTLVEEDEELRKQEEAAVAPPVKAPDEPTGQLDSAGFAEEEKQEEDALYGGPITETAPYGERPGMESASEPTAPAASSSLADEGVSREVAMWEKALKNKSQVIRKNAAKELKKLTGMDYDWKSEPSGS